MSSMPAEGSLIQLPLFARSPRAARRSPDVHAISIPARAFTGDFYFTHRAAGRLWFALGDVAGKGLPAAIVMAMIQEELEHRIHSCALTACDPSITMMRLHTFLKPLISGNRFATAVIGHLADDGTLAITNAGHCSPLILHTDGRIEPVASTGPVIGILSASQWNTLETKLAPGDALVLYSDGVVESESPAGEEFGVSRLSGSLNGHTTKEIAENILAAVNTHTGGVRVDDLTIVVVRR